MYTAVLSYSKSGMVVITVSDPENESKVHRVVSLKEDDAIKLRHWFIGMADLKGPVDYRVGNVEHFFHYEVWQPMLECLNNWFEENYASH